MTCVYDKYKRHHTSVAWHVLDKYKRHHTSVACRVLDKYKRHHTSIAWRVRDTPPHPTKIPLPPHASYMNVITPHPTRPHPFPTTQVTWTLSHPTPPHPTPSPPRKLHERYHTPPHPTPPLPPHASYMNVITPHPTPPHPFPPSGNPLPLGYIYIYTIYNMVCIFPRLLFKDTYWNIHHIHSYTHPHTFESPTPVIQAFAANPSGWGTSTSSSSVLGGAVETTSVCFSSAQPTVLPN